MDKLINESKKRPRIAKLAITKIVKLFPLNMKYEPALWKGQLYRKSPYLGASFCVINIFIVFGFGHISKYPVDIIYKTKVWPFCLLRLRRQRMRNDSSLMSKRVYYQNLLFIFAFTKNAFQQKSALKWIPTSKLLYPSFLAIACYTACVWLAQGKANVKYETFDWSTENYSQQ